MISSSAPRLRVVRKRARLSQCALAKIVGVLNSTISFIESERTNPSVAVLRKILGGVPISLSEFFAMESEAEQTIFYSREELEEIGKGEVSLRQVGSNLIGRSIMILAEIYEIGADTGRTTYRHKAEEGSIEISGRIEITVGDKRKILGLGDAYCFDSRLPHRFRQVGPEKCTLFGACSPPTF